MVSQKETSRADEITITIPVEPGDAEAGRAAAVSAAAVGRALQTALQRKASAAPRLAPREVWLYDPGYTSTACCRSAITFIDGENGILEYRGFPIEALATTCGFYTVAYMLLEGTFPADAKVRAQFAKSIQPGLDLDPVVANVVESFPQEAHPMTVFMAATAALSASRPAWNPALVRGDGGSLRLVYRTRAERQRIAQECISSLTSIAAAVFRHMRGCPVRFPKSTQHLREHPLDAFAPDGFARAFLHAADPEGTLWPEQRHASAVFAETLDVIFVLHADHELNCSTAAMRHLTSAGSDVLTCLAAAIGALYGPLHGGANEAVLNMLEEIGSPEAVEAFIASVKRQERKLMGFGHRVYRSYDPRAKILRTLAQQVLREASTEGRTANGPTTANGASDPLLIIAQTLEKRALEDPYFTERKLYPNVDFYSGVLYRAMDFPSVFFTVLFAIARTVGWLAHWMEMLERDATDAERKIVRPRQIYIGKRRQRIPLEAVEKRPDRRSRL